MVFSSKEMAILAVMLAALLATDFNANAFITSDGGYASPQSDNSYVSPKSDGSYESPSTGPGYAAPKSDESYVSPKTGEGYVAPKSDGTYSPPKTGEGYIAPKTGEGYVAPETGPKLEITTGPGYIKVEIGSGYLPPGTKEGLIDAINESVKDFGVLNETAGNVSVVIVNTTKDGEKNLTDFLLNLLNQTIKEELEKRNLTLENDTIIFDGKKRPPTFDGKFVGTWRIWLKKIFYINGMEQQGDRLGPQLHLKADGTWEYGSSSGTWLVLQIQENDWDFWQMKPYGPARKMVLNNWSGSSAEGPIEEVQGDALFWVMYNVYPPSVRWPGRMQMKFGPTFGLKDSELSVLSSGSGIVASGDGKISCGTSCVANYEPGASVALEAKPQDGSLFLEWGGACSGASPSCSLRMDSSKEVTAKFYSECTDNSQCPADKACRSSKCVPVTCECGVPREHTCVQYQCCSDSQCGEGNACDARVHRCVQKSDCRRVVYKGDPSEKIDMVFVGAGFTDYDELEDVILNILDYEEKQNGVFSVSPFKESKDKFNIWMKLAQDYPHETNKKPVTGAYESYIGSCERDLPVVVSKSAFRPFALFPIMEFGEVYLSMDTFYFPASMRGRTFLHELGHAIGGLADEYIETPKGDFTQKYYVPNCASTLEIAKERWGDLEGVEGVGYYTGVQGVTGTTYYRSKYKVVEYADGSSIWDGGCAFVTSNIRPLPDSIMMSMINLEHDFGLVNERVLMEKLERFK